MKSSKIALSLLLAAATILSTAAASASDISTEVKMTGTGVAACTLTTSAVSLGQIISGRNQPLLVPASFTVNCPVPWSVSATEGNGVIPLTYGTDTYHNEAEVSVIRADNSRRALVGSYKVSGIGSLTDTVQQLEIKIYNISDFLGPIGVGAISGSFYYTLTY